MALTYVHLTFSGTFRGCWFDTETNRFVSEAEVLSSPLQLGALKFEGRTVCTDEETYVFSDQQSRILRSWAEIQRGKDEPVHEREILKMAGILDFYNSCTSSAAAAKREPTLKQEFRGTVHWENLNKIAEKCGPRYWRLKINRTK